jgi:hypothetical protein
MRVPKPGESFAEERVGAEGIDHDQRHPRGERGDASRRLPLRLSVRGGSKTSPDDRDENTERGERERESGTKRHPASDWQR